MHEQPENKSIPSIVSPVAEHQSGHAKSRRQFLTKATTGLVIASLPARSVWASGGGVAQSIIASGHGSDFASGKPTTLYSAGYWKKNASSSQLALNFYSVFGGPAFASNGNPSLNQNLTFGNILNAKGSLNYKGPADCNFQMVAMVLNAINHGHNGMNFPVIGPDQPFPDAQSFAAYLYDKALLDPSAIGDELSSLISAYHI